MHFWNWIKEWYIKNVAVPGPKALGHSKLNALQSRTFSKFIGTNVYTWEDWENEVKIRFPVRYFLTETIPSKWRSLTGPTKRRITDFIYFIKCHTMKEYCFHKIDLRQPKGSSYEYRWGYLDACEQIMLANFTILCKFVENGSPTNLLASYTIEEIQAQGLMVQHEAYLETMAVYNYWKVERKQLLDESDRLFDEYKDEEDQSVYRAKQQLWWNAREAFDLKEDEMLIRLMKIRRALWD